MDLGVLVVFVQSNHQLVELVVEADVEIAKEYRAEAVLVQFIRNALHADLAIVLVRERRIQVAPWLDHHYRLVNCELQITVLLVEPGASEVAQEDWALVALLLPYRRVCLQQHLLEKVEFTHRNLDEHACGVNVRLLCTLDSLQVLGIVHEVVKHNHPTIRAQILIVVQPIAAILDVVQLVVAKRYRRYFVSVHTVLVVEANFYSLDDMLVEEIGHIARLIGDALGAEADEALRVELSHQTVNADKDLRFDAQLPEFRLRSHLEEAHLVGVQLPCECALVQIKRDRTWKLESIARIRDRRRIRTPIVRALGILQYDSRPLGPRVKDHIRQHVVAANIQITDVQRVLDKLELDLIGAALDCWSVPMASTVAIIHLLLPPWSILDHKAARACNQAHYQPLHHHYQ